MTDTTQHSVAWLVESEPGGLWWDGRFVSRGIDPRFFTRDPNEAVRFARREDAEKVAASSIALKATEHVWLASQPQQAANEIQVNVRPSEWRSMSPEARGVLRKLVFAARTTGGTAGHDQGLTEACDAAEALLLVDAEKAAQPQQAITGRPATGTEAEVIDDIRRRQALGINKYGVTVRDNPLSFRQWLQHAYEECLDQAIYLKRAMEEMDRSQEELKHLNDEAGARTCEHCGCDMTKAFQDHKDGCPNIPL